MKRWNFSFAGSFTDGVCVSAGASSALTCDASQIQPPKTTAAIARMDNDFERLFDFMFFVLIGRLLTCPFIFDAGDAVVVGERMFGRGFESWSAHGVG
jgi:hypothetical protein